MSSASHGRSRLSAALRSDARVSPLVFFDLVFAGVTALLITLVVSETLRRNSVHQQRAGR